MPAPHGVEDSLKKRLSQIKPVLEASLDPLCVVSKANRVVYLNLAMKTMLGLTARELKVQPVFCDLVKLNACEKTCQIELHVLGRGKPLRLDQEPARRETEKLRLLLNAIPLSEVDGKSPIGAIIALRDVTGEVVLQAKYHKLVELNENKGLLIEELEVMVRGLRQSLRHAREGAH